MAARCVDTDDGGVILLWVRLKPEDIEVELGFEDDLDDDDDFNDLEDFTEEDFDDFDVDEDFDDDDED